MAASPSLAGACQLTTGDPLPGVAVTLLGAPGAVAAMATGAATTAPISRATSVAENLPRIFMDAPFEWGRAARTAPPPVRACRCCSPLSGSAPHTGFPFVTETSGPSDPCRPPLDTLTPVEGE